MPFAPSSFLVGRPGLEAHVRRETSTAEGSGCQPLSRRHSRLGCQGAEGAGRASPLKEKKQEEKNAEKSPDKKEKKAPNQARFQ